MYSGDTVQQLLLALFPDDSTPVPEAPTPESIEPVTAEAPPTEDPVVPEPEPTPAVGDSPAALESVDPPFVPSADSVPVASPPLVFAEPTAEECSHFGGCNAACLAKRAAERVAVEPEESFEAPPPVVLPATVPSPPVRACPHVGSDGKCLSCTGDELKQCRSCPQDEDEYPTSELVKCKEEECDSYFCSGCREDGLSEHGYCQDHDSVTCSGCNDDIDRGTEIACSRRRCQSGLLYCDECAKDLLAENGRCHVCADEEIGTCDDCGGEFINSKLAECAEEDCEQAFCSECKEKNLNKKGFCLECDPDDDNDDLDDEDEESDEDEFDEFDDEDGSFDLDDDDFEDDDDEDDDDSFFG